MSNNAGTCGTELAALIADDCRRNVKFAHELKVKGLIGIMADQRDVSWVDLNKTFVNVANSVDAGLENARQPWNRGMQSPPQNMVKEAQILRPNPPRVMRCMPSPAQHHDPPRFDVPQGTARPRMRSPAVPCAPRVPTVPRMRRPQVKLQRLPGIVSAGLATVMGTERQTSAPEDMLPKTPKCNGSDLSPKKMEKREEPKKVKGDEDRSNGNENQKCSKEDEKSSPVKAKDIKSLKRANEEPFETHDESPEKNGVNAFFFLFKWPPIKSTKIFK